MPVSQILPALEQYTVLSESQKALDKLSLPLTQLCCDSRKAHDLSLFFCLPGKTVDGHSFAQPAYDAGTRVFAVEHRVNLPEDALQIQVPHTRDTLSDAAAAFYGHPEKEMQLVGITGTKGKTSTAQMIAHILNRNGIPTGYIGTNGIEFAGMHFPTVNSTPESLVIYQYLRYMVDEGIHTCVMEISSQGLWMKRIRGLVFSVCIFTNLSEDHIGGVEHPDYQHYAACKHSLFTDYPSKLIVCNADDPAAAYMMQDVTSPIVYTSVTTPSPDGLPAAWYASDIRPARQGDRVGARFTCVSPNGTATPCDAFLPLPGRFNVQNALAAIAACCDGFHLDVSTVIASLAHTAVPGRFETVTSPCLPGVTFIIDYAHNGISLTSILDTLRELHPRRLICLFGSVGGRSRGRRKDLALAAGTRADLCILTADNPGSENPLSIIKEIDANFGENACPRLCIPDRAEAIATAVSLAQPGDIVLLAGKGHETYQLIGTSAVPFSDRQVLEDALRTWDAVEV